MNDLGHSLEKRFNELQQLNKIIQKINTGILLDDILTYAYEAFHPIIPYDRIGFSFLEDDGKVLRSRWARTEAPVMKINRGYSARMEGSSLQKIVETGQPRILNDLESYLKEHPASESTRLIVEEGMRSSLTCPLIALNKPIGFMFFSSLRPDTYQNAHVEIFMEIASHMSVIAEKSRLYERLLQLNELKNEFLGTAAHDLRSPLALILESSRMLLEGVPVPASEKQNQFLKLIRDSSKFMLMLVNDYLDISAIESGKLELLFKPIDFKELLEKNTRMNRSFAQKKNIEITLKLPEEECALFADDRRIEQVLNNLISNAIKFSHPGGKIAVELTGGEKEVTVSVRDSGQGIAKEELDRLFLPFSRASARPTGGEESTGLGLLIAKKMVESHGGKIWAESGPAQGLVFFFSLPKDSR